LNNSAIYDTVNRRVVTLWSLPTWWPKLRSLIRWLWCIHCQESMRSGTCYVCLPPASSVVHSSHESY